MYIINLIIEEVEMVELYKHPEKFKVNQFMLFWRDFRPLAKIHITYEPKNEKPLVLFNNEAREFKGV